ncbi:MAG: YfhO family protein [Saprospiraceae bacterium]|nr:YfhO family protein [Saprospiraceae bacterium]
MIEPSQHSTSNIRTRGLYYAFIFLAIFIAIWQISCFKYTLKWDAIDITLPWRHFISDALLNNQLPWWNPYQFHGFAQGLSLETWYPLALILGAASRYDLYTLNLEYLLHLLIAAYGFYRLARVVKINHEGALWGCLVFSLSGFFVANAQHTGWIASGAWIPHVLASYFIWKRQPNLNNSLILTMLVFMLASGGYIAYTIITAYILFALGAFEGIKSIARGNHKEIFWRYGRLIFCIATSCALLLVCLWQLKWQIDRGGGLSGDTMLKGSLYFKHLISLIYPFATVKGDYGFWSGDQSMMNVYMGLPALILLALSIRKIKFRFYAISWLLALASLALALAMELPFRGWANALPFLDLFRFPSLFRYYTVLVFTLIAARTLSDLMTDKVTFDKQKMGFGRMVQIFLGIICIVGLVLFLMADVEILQIIKLSIHRVSEAIVLQSLLHALALTGFLLLWKTTKTRLAFFQLLLLFTAIDLIISCQLNGRVSIFSEHSFASIQPCLKSLPQDYPVPSMHDFIGSNSDKNLQFGPVYRNNNTLYKRMGWDGYTPYQYQTFIDFEKTPYYRKSLDLPFLFISKPISQPGDNVQFYDSDPILNKPEDELNIRSFSPNSFSAWLNLGTSSTLVLNQNFVPNWHVTVDDQPGEIVRIDHSLMGVRVPEGPHVVRFNFVPGHLYNALIISFFSLLLCSLFYFWLNRKSLPHKLLLTILIIIGLFRILRPIFYPIEPSQDHNLINYSDRFLDKGDLERLKDVAFDQDSSFSFAMESNCLPGIHVLSEFLSENFPSQDSTYQLDQKILEFSPMPSSAVFRTDLRFEAFNPLWKNQGNGLVREKNNTFQSLLGVKYGASIEIDLNEFDPVNQIKISIEHRNTEPIDAAIVCSIVLTGGKEIWWKSMTIPDSQAVQGKWRALNWRLEMPKLDSEPGYLKIHVWNRGTSNLQIDNFSLSLFGK